MTPEERDNIAEMLRTWLEEYKPRAAESIWTNRHMNSLEERTDMSVEEVGTVLDPFMEACVERCRNMKAWPSKGDVLNAMSSEAGSYMKALSLDDEEMNVAAALVVDLINAVGMNLWVDWAIYARDVWQSKATANSQ